MEQKLTFELTVEQANLVLGALGELPFKVSAPLVQALQEQAQAQLGTDQSEPEFLAEQ